MRIPDIGRRPAVGRVPAEPSVDALVPRRAGGRPRQVFGNIYLTEKQSGRLEFSDEDEAALVVLATQAGVAIENARLYEETQLRPARSSRGSSCSRTASGSRRSCTTA